MNARPVDWVAAAAWVVAAVLLVVFWTAVLAAVL